jgi:hypothetical protein
METKKYEVEIMGTTYRTYYITAESQEKAEELAFKEVDADWEISKVWKQNAEISFSDEIEEGNENNNN